MLLGEGEDNARAVVAVSALSMTARYYPEHVPTEALRAASAACPRILRLAAVRQLADGRLVVELARSRVPGIGSSTTPLEVLRFIRTRSSPPAGRWRNPVARQAQPQLDAVPWYQLSHGRRIVRWLSSRPARANDAIGDGSSMGRRCTEAIARSSPEQVRLVRQRARADRSAADAIGRHSVYVASPIELRAENIELVMRVSGTQTTFPGPEQPEHLVLAQRAPWTARRT